MENCQLPSVCGSAALAVIATAFSVYPLVLERELEKRLAMVSPVGSLLSSEIAASDTLPVEGSSTLVIVSAAEMKLVEPPRASMVVAVTRTTWPTRV